MAAALCQHFVQNAWKKDLCSNCFKSKEEHNGNGTGSNADKSRYLSALYPNRPLPWKPQGILKTGPRKDKSAGVRFPAEEAQVIGYGGEECFSDLEDDAGGDDSSGSEDEVAVGEEEKTLQRLTKANTDFNAVAANLLTSPAPGDSKKTFTQLMLGRPLVDAEGRRKTLLVSVTPFGGNEEAKPKTRNGETPEDNVDSVVLKSVLKNGARDAAQRAKADESETQGVDSNDSEGVSSQNTLLKPALKLSDAITNNVEGPCESKVCLESEDPKPVESPKRKTSSDSLQKGNPSSKENVSKPSPNDGENLDNKVSRIPVIKTRMSPDKFKAISRTAAFNGRSDLQNKAEEVLPKPAVRKAPEPAKRPDNPTRQLTANAKSPSGKKEATTSPLINGESNAKLTFRVATLKFTESNNHKSALREHNKIVHIKKPLMNNLGEKVPEKQQEIVETLNLEVKPLSKSVVETKNLANSTVETKNLVNSAAEHKIQMNNSVEIQNAMNCFVGAKTLTHSPPDSKSLFNYTAETQRILNSCVGTTNFFKSSIENKCNLISDVECNNVETSVVESDRLVSCFVEDMICNDNSVVESNNVESKVDEADDCYGDVGRNVLKVSQAEAEVTMSVLTPLCKILGESRLEQELAFHVEESRELAGEPDGRADPDENSEPPALPRSPPPILDPRPSFLHGFTKRSDKPKVPAKPSKVLQSAAPKTATEAVECTRTPQKRQAPKPPPLEDTPAPLFTRNPSQGLCKGNSPVTRGKEKRERASSCSPRPEDATPHVQPPEPAPRRALSQSVESLAATPPLEQQKKSHGRGRFSLRKLLRLGGLHRAATSLEDGTVAVNVPSPRPRLEIIHPQELNGTTVEVLSSGRRSAEELTTSERRDSELSSDSYGSASHSSSGRPSKPPPPPRNQSLDAWGKGVEGATKPMRPPPPKSAELLRKQKQVNVVSPAMPTDSVYANLGEVRSGLAPNKPQRTASIRDTNTDRPRRPVCQPDNNGYESVELRNGSAMSSVMLDSGENVYECVAGARSSSPECDSGAKSPHARYLSPQRRSEGCVESSPDYLKFRGSFLRSTSLPYCGSETESDIYSPYSFYSSEDAGDDESEWMHPWKTSKLRLRKGRSIVHRSLEDNYGAVTLANHEALLQVLEQVHQCAVVPPGLRALKAASNLRWSDFAVPEDSRGTVVGRRVFHAALWGLQSVTLSLVVDQGLHNGLSARGCFTLHPLAEFADLVPAKFLPIHPSPRSKLVQVSVAVLARVQVDSVQSYSQLLADKTAEERSREASFVLLQLVNGLKSLQAQGIEETSPCSFVVCRDERDPVARLCLLQGLAPAPSPNRGSLCRCALTALALLSPATSLTTLLGDVLSKERSESLTQAKSVLEFSLWGPADLSLGATDREVSLQRWLDLERATVLHGLVRARVELTAFEECHLLFLARTNASAMAEASSLLETQCRPPETTTF